MEKVTDIQDKNGVSKEIQDKDLAQQTAATAIASTDYVMLQDTDGGYHKIAKASFTEAVRSALGSVINSVAKGTDIAKVPVLDSNNDLGMGSLANLASVLGVTGWKDGMICYTDFGVSHSTFESAFTDSEIGVIIGAYSSGIRYAVFGVKASNSYGAFVKITYEGDIISKCCMLYGGSWTWY